MECVDVRFRISWDDQYANLSGGRAPTISLCGSYFRRSKKETESPAIKLEEVSFFFHSKVEPNRRHLFWWDNQKPLISPSKGNWTHCPINAASMVIPRTSITRQKISPWYFILHCFVSYFADPNFFFSSQYFGENWNLWIKNLPVSVTFIAKKMKFFRPLLFFFQLNRKRNLIFVIF